MMNETKYYPHGLLTDNVNGIDSVGLATWWLWEIILIDTLYD